MFFLFIGTQGYSNKVIPTKQTSEQVTWEQSESRKIFGEARRFQIQSNLIEALKLYSEILEFFPNTDVWPLACIELSDIYLHRKNINASEKVLKRLLSARSAKGLVQDEHTLLAQWDFFEQLGRINDLIIWADKRNADEKLILREASTLTQRLHKLARNEKLANLTELEQLFTAIGYQKSLHGLIALMDHPDFLFPEKRMQELMIKSISINDHNLLRRIVMTMQKAGWAKTSHQVFLDYRDHPQKSSWQRLWIQLLIDAHMWEEVTKQLENLPAQDWSREILLTSIGQGKWEEAFVKIQQLEKWIFSSLIFEDLVALAKGLQQNTLSQNLYQDFLKMMPMGGKKDLLLATLSKNVEEKTALLHKLKLDPYYYQKATLELGKIFQKGRETDKILQLYNELQEKHPDSQESKELKLILDTLKSLEKPKI